MAVRPDDSAGLVDRLTASFHLLGYVFPFGALVVGFAFLCGRQELARWERVVCRIVLLAAIGSVIGLLFRSLLAEWRKRQRLR